MVGKETKPALLGQGVTRDLGGEWLRGGWQTRLDGLILREKAVLTPAGAQESGPGTREVVTGPWREGWDANFLV